MEQETVAPSTCQLWVPHWRMSPSHTPAFLLPPHAPWLWCQMPLLYLANTLLVQSLFQCHLRMLFYVLEPKSLTQNKGIGWRDLSSRVWEGKDRFKVQISLSPENSHAAFFLNVFFKKTNSTCCQLKTMILLTRSNILKRIIYTSISYPTALEVTVTMWSWGKACL